MKEVPNITTPKWIEEVPKWYSDWPKGTVFYTPEPKLMHQARYTLAIIYDIYIDYILYNIIIGLQNLRRLMDASHYYCETEGRV